MAPRSRKSKRSPAAAEAPLDREAVIDAAMALFAERGWSSTSILDIAEAAGTSLAALLPVYPSKLAILHGFMGRIDAVVLARTAESDASVRERLFEIFMRRFDALQPYRAALTSLARDLPRDPCAAIGVARRMARSLNGMAELSGVGTGGPLGLLRVKALGALHLWVMRTWLADTSADMAKTMKALDQGLSRLEGLARGVPRVRRETAAAAAS